LICHILARVTDSHLFFVRLHSPLISTLFPYTTLFRSNSFKTKQLKPFEDYMHTLIDHHNQTELEESMLYSLFANGKRLRPLLLRSEEHTSELQSRFDLVCRLLLEKKKIKTLS